MHLHSLPIALYGLLSLSVFSNGVFARPAADVADRPLSEPATVTTNISDTLVSKDLEPRAVSKPPNIGNYAYQGCYVESTGFWLILGLKSTYSTSMTLEKCAADCADFPYFGAENARNCHCGNVLYGSPAQASQSDCNRACAGNTAETCGGLLRVDVYQRPNTIAGVSALPSSILSPPMTSTKVPSITLSSSTRRTSTSSIIPIKLTTKASSPVPTSTKVATSSAPRSSSTLSSTTTIPGPRKRGLAYNDASLTAPFLTSNSQISWGYNWYSAATGGLSSTLEFVPMLWDNSTDRTTQWFSNVNAAIASGTTHVMAFNEPDFVSQSNMSPQAAAQAYLRWLQPLAGKVKLGAPAVTNGGAPMGLTWLSEFLGNCTGCTIDFVPFHWYDSATNTPYFRNYILSVHALVPHKPLWLTEFSGSGTSDQQVAFLQLVMPWLDSLSYIERYSWFYDAVGYLVNSGPVLSATGAVYNSFTSNVIDPIFTS